MASETYRFSKEREKGPQEAVPRENPLKDPPNSENQTRPKAGSEKRRLFLLFFGPFPLRQKKEAKILEFGGARGSSQGLRRASRVAQGRLLGRTRAVKLKKAIGLGNDLRPFPYPSP